MAKNAPSRLLWIDALRGFIVIYVVLYQATTRVGYYMPSEGFVYWLAEYGRSIRMPSLFFISGLLIASSLHKNWRDFLKSKVYHLVFFFILWSLVQIIMQSGKMPLGDFLSFGLKSLTLQPISSLWFIIVLPVFFVIAKMTRDVPPPIMLVIAALLQLAHIGPYSIWSDNTSRYFIYFYLGMMLAPSLPSIKEGLSTRKAWIFSGGFFLLNGVMIASGQWSKPIISLLLSLSAITAFITLFIAIEKSSLAIGLGFLGKNSLVIYLGYAPFLILLLSLLQKTPLRDNFSFLALISWAGSIIAAIMLWLLVRKTPLKWLFETPKWLK